MDLHSPSPPSSTPQRRTPFELKYLTPHKVLLLILVHAYCTASIPSQSHAQVFALLLEHINVSFPLDRLLIVLAGTKRTSEPHSDIQRQVIHFAFIRNGRDRI